MILNAERFMLTPEQLMSASAYIQNGSYSYSGRNLDICDGVITYQFDNASANWRSIFLTKILVGLSGGASSTVPPSGTLEPIDKIKGATHIETLTEITGNPASITFRIEFCTISEDTESVVSAKAFTNQNGLQLLNLSVPATATHYAIRIYNSTPSTDGEYTMRLLFRAFPSD